MSQFVDEIIKSIKENPTEWKDYRGYGLEKGNIIIFGYGNTKLLSICHVKINDKVMPTTYIDCWNLEGAVGNWYKTVKLNTILV